MTAAASRDGRRPLQWAALVLVALTLWVLGPVLAPVVAAGFAVLIASHAFERLVVAMHGRRALAAALATAMITVAVFAPLAAALYFAGAQAVAAGQSLLHAVGRAGGVDAYVAQVAPWLRDRIPAASDTAVSALVAWASRLTAWAPRVVRSAGWITAEALLAVVSMYYFFAEGPSFVGFLRKVSPLARAQTDALLSEFHEVAIGLFRGNVVVALFHAVSAAVGYAMFGVRHVFLLGAITMIASFVPLVGTSIVWAPVAVGLALAQHTGRAVGLVAWCLVVVGASDQIVRPFVSRGRMALPRLLLFLTLFGGLEALGPKGLLIGPLVGSLAVTALRLLAAEPRVR